METVYFGHRRINILDNPLNESEKESDSLDGFVKMLSTEEGIAAYNKAFAEGLENEHDNVEENTEEATDTSTDISPEEKSAADAIATAAETLSNISTTDSSIKPVYLQ